MSSVHLIVCHHGFMGNSSHLNSIVSHLRTLSSPDHVVLHNSRVNHMMLTMDGMDVCGLRFAQEINLELKKLRDEAASKQESPLEVVKLSVIGYSLGGCIARYAIGVMEEAGELAGLVLKNFITFATPHLGSRKIPGVYGSAFNWVTPRLCSRTGRIVKFIGE